MSAGGMGVSVALKSGGPNSHLCPRSCKMAIFRVFAKMGRLAIFLKASYNCGELGHIATSQVKSSLFS